MVLTERTLTQAEVLATARELGLDPAFIQYKTAKLLTYPDGHMALGFMVAVEVDPRFFASESDESSD